MAAETGAAIRCGHSRVILMKASPSPGQADHTGLTPISPVPAAGARRRFSPGRDPKAGAAFSLKDWLAEPLGGDQPPTFSSSTSKIKV
ncbi:MAG: hypothetical protein ACK512_01840, partial [Cyanobium sp.]